MNHTHDRRAPGTARIPFDAMVEVGGALGPTFEAQAVNLSEQGMSLRTAYLPEVGQPVMCRFDAGEGSCVTAAGEVLWNDPAGDGGEFGIRFTNLDAASTVALQRVLGMVDDGRMVLDPGRKVRLHIEGLASPMRARVKDQQAASVTAYSDLGFLQVGRSLELEDAASGARRPALIDRVEVELDGASLVPQLVVSLRYDDTDARGATVEASAPEAYAEAAGDQDEPGVRDEDEDEIEEAARADELPAIEANAATAEDDASEDELKSSFARSAAKITPALLAWMKRAKTTASLLASRARRGAGGLEMPLRRTTAPAPGGGLRASGRKVVRGGAPDDALAEATARRALSITKRRAAVGGALGVATLLVFLAVRKPDPTPELASAAPAPEATAETMPTAVITALPPAESTPIAPSPEPVAAAVVPSARPARPAPFTNGAVGTRPTVIRIKMDGPVERILGASQPTGFTVVIPNRMAVDPTDTLADKDPRISDVDASNEPTGAELNVSFKDGVPNYVVRARGDTLEVLLARANSHGSKAPEAKVKPKPNKKRDKKR